MDRATVHGDLEAENDVAIIACGEMVRPALEAAKILQEKGIKAVVADMYCVKPLDQDTVIKATWLRYPVPNDGSYPVPRS